MRLPLSVSLLATMMVSAWAGAHDEPPLHMTMGESPTVIDGFVDPLEHHWLPFSADLAERGLCFQLTYSADFLTNTQGGINSSDAFQYRGVLNFGLALDTHALEAWHGGTFYFNAVNNHGRNISERHVGDLQALNNNDAPNDWRIYQVWYQHTFMDDRLRIKIGKMDLNSDFAGGVHRGEFIHGSAGFSPTIPLTSWPDTTLGVAAFFEPAEWVYIQGGLFDALGTSTRAGFDTAFHSPDEAFVIAELGIRPRLTLFGIEDLPGQYSIGGFYHSGSWSRIRDDLGGRLSPRSATGNAGVYLAFDQLVYREEPVDDSAAEQGLGVFFQFGWAPSDRNMISQHYGAGFQYYGPIPTRDQDIVGLGVQHVSLSGAVQSLEERFSETAIECFYHIHVTDWLSIKPDLQVIVNPGGDGRDALVAGVRLVMSL